VSAIILAARDASITCRVITAVPLAGAWRYKCTAVQCAAGDVSGVFNEGSGMCRNIKLLFNFEPPVTDDEVRAAALQFVRKVSGFNKPSLANEVAFQTAVDEIATVSGRLLRSLKTNAPTRSREEEAAKARARSAERFSR
jgi:hypothetical protein